MTAINVVINIFLRQLNNVNQSDYVGITNDPGRLRLAIHPSVLAVDHVQQIRKKSN